MPCLIEDCVTLFRFVSWEQCVRLLDAVLDRGACDLVQLCFMGAVREAVRCRA